MAGLPPVPPAGGHGSAGRELGCAPTNYRSFCSHSDLEGQLSAMTQLRAKAGDTNALREYALWLKAIEPQHFFYQIGPMLTPLARFPDSPAWTGLLEWLFDDEKSAWFNYLHEQHRPDPKRWSSPELNVEVFFGTPVIKIGDDCRLQPAPRGHPLSVAIYSPTCFPALGRG